MQDIREVKLDMKQISKRCSKLIVQRLLHLKNDSQVAEKKPHKNKKRIGWEYETW